MAPCAAQARASGRAEAAGGAGDQHDAPAQRVGHVGSGNGRGHGWAVGASAPRLVAAAGRAMISDPAYLPSPTGIDSKRQFASPARGRYNFKFAVGV